MFGYLRRAITAAVDPCADAPTISSVNKDSDVVGTCPQGWATGWSLTISGTLQAGQEYYVQYRNGSSPGAGSWTFWERTTSTTISTYEDPNVGSDGTGGSNTRYVTMRAYVVPTGGDAGDACSGPTTGMSTAERPPSTPMSSMPSGTTAS